MLSSFVLTNVYVQTEQCQMKRGSSERSLSFCLLLNSHKDITRARNKTAYNAIAKEKSMLIILLCRKVYLDRLPVIRRKDLPLHKNIPADIAHA